MKQNLPFSVSGKRAVLATMHRKEQVMKPLLEAALGLNVHVPGNFDTDRFGTFSREIERSGSQFDAARAKIAAAFEHDNEAVVGIASEGSFGPHPYLPFATAGRELVVLIDRETGLEIVGHYADLATNFQHETVQDTETATRFADRIGFPAHGLIVIGYADSTPTPDRFLEKNTETFTDLSAAVAAAISACGAAHIETDMRAHRNPTRMRAIKRATIDLVRRYRSHCSECARPGFAMTKRLTGLPCSWCGEPTIALRAEVLTCDGCGHRLEKPMREIVADPSYCTNCNP